MKNIYKALNVKSEKELFKLIESLNLTTSQYINFVYLLQEESLPETIRSNVLNYAKTLNNNIYENIVKNIKKKHETVFDDSWYQVKGQKYPKKGKDGLIVESKDNKENEFDDDSKKLLDIDDDKDYSLKNDDSDLEIEKFIGLVQKISETTDNINILKNILESIDKKIVISNNTEQTNELNNLKEKIELKIKSMESINESYNKNIYESVIDEDEDIFEIGDVVLFNDGIDDNEIIGKVININNDMYISYDIKTFDLDSGKEVIYPKMDYFSNTIKRVYDEKYLNPSLSIKEICELYKNNSTEDYDNYIYDELNETCSAGATCSASVALTPKSVGKIKRRKPKKESFDLKLFKESIIKDVPCKSMINNHLLSYFKYNNKFYLGYDNGLIKTLDKNVMLETIDKIYNNEDYSDVLLEGYSCYEMDLLLEDENIESPDENMEQEKTPEEKEYEDELKQNIGNTSKTYSTPSAEDKNQIKNGQQIIGYDDVDKKFILKGEDGKTIKVDSRNIKMDESLDYIKIQGIYRNLNNDEKRIYSKVKLKNKLYKKDLNEYDQNIATNMVSKGLLKRYKEKESGKLYFKSVGRKEVI